MESTPGARSSRGRLVFVGTLLSGSVACGHTSPPTVPALPLAAPPPSADVEREASSSDPRQEYDDAVLLGTLLASRHRVGWSLGSVVGGVTTTATSAVWGGVTGIYVAKGGSFMQAAGPLVFGVGGVVLGIYQLIAGTDLGAIQLDYLLAVNQGSTPRMLLESFEPRLRDASVRARSQRHWFAGSSLALAALSIAAGTFLVASPPQELQSSTYPSVMFGLGAINALAGLSTLIQPTPTETAWDSYVRLTSR
jgi:hypothetical protein